MQTKGGEREGHITSCNPHPPFQQSNSSVHFLKFEKEGAIIPPVTPKYNLLRTPSSPTHPPFFLPSPPIESGVPPRPYILHLTYDTVMHMRRETGRGKEKKIIKKNEKKRRGKVDGEVYMAEKEGVRGGESLTYDILIAEVGMGLS